jgi:hypothetical protein
MNSFLHRATLAPQIHPMTGRVMAFDVVQANRRPETRTLAQHPVRPGWETRRPLSLLHEFGYFDLKQSSNRRNF